MVMTTTTMYRIFLCLSHSGDGFATVQKFGFGACDLIVFDEAHRSFYGKNDILFKYFDALKLGLTATPSKEESKDTFKLFKCEVGKPTVKYDYDIAVDGKKRK